MCDSEENWIINSPRFHPTLSYRCVDDTFSMFDSKDTAKEFLKYLKGRHNTIKLVTIEFEQAEEIPFLDILVKRCPNNTFVTSVYRNKTFTGLYTKWDSFTPRKYKANLDRTLIIRQTISLKIIGFSMDTSCWSPSEGLQHGDRKAVETPRVYFGCFKTFIFSVKLENIPIGTSLNILVTQNSKT